MATTTICRQKPKTGSWSTIFPTEQVTEQQSALFVKKLLAVAISNITYLRTIFPEHAFGDRCLEDLNLKILRDDSACPGACQVIQWVKGCFDALDKKYLRTMVVGIYMDSTDPDSVVETYTFKFSYSQEGITIFRNGNKVVSAYTEAETRKATIKLLRSIVVLTQTLKPLPDDVMMTMKLCYYDEVTPTDYEPPGFQATVSDDFAFREDPMNIRVGDVSTPFHTVKLRIRTDCEQFSFKDKEEEQMDVDHPPRPPTHPPSLTDRPEDGDTAESAVQACEPKERAGSPLQPPITMMAQGEGPEGEGPEGEGPEGEGPDGEGPEGEGPEGEKPEGAGSEGELAKREGQEAEGEPVVRCPCGCNEDDGLMVLCGVCTVWQHAFCFALLSECDVPELHVCVQCARPDEAGGHPCTDPFLQFLSSAALQATCLWRRALMACTEMTRVVTPGFARRLGVEITVAQGLINRLEREGYVRAPARGKKLGKLVNKEKLRAEAIRKYFKKPSQPIDQGVRSDGELETMTEGASSLNLTTEKPSGLPHLDNGARRSPRIAQKRVRSIVEPSVEFEVSDSQDHDASLGQRRKRRKASIASRSILV